jgi:hypothetical protein
MQEIIDSAEKSVYKPEGIVEVTDLTFEGVHVSDSFFSTRHLEKFYNKKVKLLYCRNLKFINCLIEGGFINIGNRACLENVEFVNLKCDELFTYCYNSFKDCFFSGRSLKKLNIAYLGGVEKINYGKSSSIDLDISEHLGEVDIYNFDLNRVVTNPDTQFKLRYQDFEDFDFKKFGIKRRGEIGYCIRSLQKGRIETLIASFPKKNDDFYEQFQSEYPVLKDLGIIS